MNPAGFHTNEDVTFNSYLSFRPLVEALRRNIEEGNPGMQKLYGQVLREIESHPALLETITEMADLRGHTELIEELLSAIFPPTTTNFMYGIALPFREEAVYVSPVFRENLLKPGTNEILLPETLVGSNLTGELVTAAYGVILKKFMGVAAPDTYRLTYPYTDPGTGLTRYMELRIDTRFIDVRPIKGMPKMPASLVDPHANRLLKPEEIRPLVPLDQFVFEGLMVLRLNDVTGSAVITEIKNRLLDLDTLSDTAVYSELEAFVQSLIGLRDLNIGITPFFRINKHYVYSEIHNTNSILFRHFQGHADKDEISDYCKVLFRDNDQPLLFETLQEQNLNDIHCLQYYYREGARSVLICPLKQGTELIGLLEIVSPIAGELKPGHINKIESVIPLFTLGLEKSLDQLNYEVDKIIKKKFTAVQPAVEWKFTEVALDYLGNLTRKGYGHINRIAFSEVWPLYAAIDIRNSSIERSESIRKDIVEQLELARTITRKAQERINFPLLPEIDFKIGKHLLAASDGLQSEEELLIQEFLKEQVMSVFHHLHHAEPALKNDLEHYFSMLDPLVGMLYHHRRDYEESVTRINDSLARFIDKEQLAAQKVYPHYFERFVTDGLEYNIYMGQSITPRKKFDLIYLHNLKMWQLTVMAKAARMTHQLLSELKRPLRTTQLILSHSQQLSVLFRTEERKFDVDGAYNVRYEIVKKRIDKAHIRDTNERLTQPGKIAIVYSQAADATEYTEYIEFLQSQGLIKPGIEHLELEDMQGVSGMKALRVDVNLDDPLVAASVHLVP